MKRAGDSFPEVLFAVVVLGIGFIMIAAIFPVAISQTKATLDETTAAALVRDAVNTLSKSVLDNSGTVLNQLPMPASGTNPSNYMPTYPGQVSRFDTTNGWRTIRGSLISRDNPRFAFVPIYRRDGNPAPVPLPPVPPPQPTPADSAQLFVILVQCRALQRPAGLPAVPMGGPNMMGGTPVSVPARTELAFDRYDVGLDLLAAGPPISNPNNLCPHQVKIQLIDGGVGPDIMTVNAMRNAGPGAAENLPDAIAEGAYIVLADGNTPASAAPADVQKVLSQRGRVYRVGAVKDNAAQATVPPPGNAAGTPIPYPIEWELQPGSDLASAAENTLPAGTDINAWVVGRERLSDGTFIGPTQDVGFYTTFISATK